MKHLLEKKDHWGHGSGLWILALLAMLVPPALYALSGTDLDNDIRKWMPEEDPNAVTLRWYEQHFPQQESVLVSWDGNSLNDPRIAWLHDRLVGVPDADGVRHGGLKQVERVVTPQELLRRIEEDGIEHDDALARLQGVLIGTGPLKIHLTETGRSRRKSTVKTLLDRVRDDVGIELEVLDPAVEWIPRKSIEEYALARAIVETEDPEPFPPLPDHDLQVRWEGLQSRGLTAARVIEVARSLKSDDSALGESLVKDAFFAPGSPLTVAVILSEAGDADKHGTIKALRAVAAEVGIPDDTLHLGGRPVAGAALNASVKQAGWNRDYPLSNLPKRSIVLFSGLVGIILAFVMLRSVVLASLVLFVSYYTVILTVAVVPATGGSMNMVLVVMPTLLLVLTMSGAIHVANYWRFAARLDPATAPVTAAKLAARPCTLASLTTAFGLLSLLTSPLRPVADFGLYSALGCVVGLGVVLYGLPALLEFVPPEKKRVVGHASPLWGAFADALTSHRRTVCWSCLLVFAVCSAGLKWFDTETKIIKFFPNDSRIVQDYHWIEQNIGGIIPVDVVVRFSRSDRAPAENGLLFAERQELVRRIQQKLIARHDDITGALSLATFRPADSAEELQRKATNAFQRRIDAQTEQKVHESSVAHSFVQVAADDGDLTSPGDRKLCATDDELWRITAQVNIMTDIDYSELMTDIDAIVREETSQQAGANHVVTGMIPIFLETQQAVLTSLIKSFLLAFVVIGGVIAWVLKGFRAGLVTMLPNVLPISTVFGAISWFGIPVDIGTMITASVALGIAVDGTLHLLTWFREGARHGQSQSEAIANAMSHCAPALCQTSIAVGIGLLVLMPAELSLISRFGWLMAAMIFTALAADLIFLPALLAGWLGRMIIQTDADVAAASRAHVISSETTLATSPMSPKSVQPDDSLAATVSTPLLATPVSIVATELAITPRNEPPAPHLFQPESRAGHSSTGDSLANCDA